jgi:hypothetical protein
MHSLARRACLAALATLCGCAGTPPEPLLPDSQRVQQVQDALDQEFEVARSLCFRSFNGRWIGTDCDSEIELRADGSATLTEYGYTVEAYAGSYRINPQSELVLNLKTYRGSWPAMALYRDHAGLLLAPASGPGGFVMGNRAGATVMGGGSFWPFRLILQRNQASPPQLLAAAPKLRPVALPDGSLKCYVPDGKGGVASVVSTNRGETWSEPVHELDLPEKLGLSLSLLDEQGEVHLVFMHGVSRRSRDSSICGTAARGKNARAGIRRNASGKAIAERCSTSRKTRDAF